MTLDSDDQLVESWESLCKEYIKLNRLSDFAKRLSDFIYFENLRDSEELRAYHLRRLGEWAEQDSGEARKASQIAKASKEARTCANRRFV